MTWAKLSDTFIDDPALLGLSRGVRLFYVEATVWSCKHETDGLVPGHVVHRFTDEPDVKAAVDELVEAGLWTRTDDDGYLLTRFTDEQRAKSQIEEERAENRERQERRRLHVKGDHSKCISGRYCPDGAVSRRDNPRDNTRESREPDPTRPDPTSKGGEGRKGSAVAPANAALGAESLTEQTLAHIVALARLYEANPSSLKADEHLAADVIADRDNEGLPTAGWTVGASVAAVDRVLATFPHNLKTPAARRATWEAFRYFSSVAEHRPSQFADVFPDVIADAAENELEDAELLWQAAK